MDLIQKDEYYKIVGLCMEVHRHLGGGLLEIVYIKMRWNMNFKRIIFHMKEKKNILLNIKRHSLAT